MRREIVTLLLSLLPFTVIAQDVIVKRDGSSIISKVLEVNKSDVKYKKFSNQNGPTYTIDIIDILAINYENGEKDDFNTQAPSVASPVQTPSKTIISADANIAQQNVTYIESLNQHIVRFQETPKDKQAKMLYCTLGVKGNSQLLNDEVKILLKTGDRYSSIEKKTEFGQHGYSVNAEMQVTIQNTSNRTLYIDLGNSFFKRNGEASPYYIPSSTSSTTSNGNGASVNLGAVTGALGVGGAVGTLANGVNVGGGSTQGTTNTVYAQRIIAIPPMSTKKLEPQQFFPTGCRLWQINGENYYKFSRAVTYPKQKMNWGDTLNFTENESPLTFGIYITYSEDESCQTTKSLQGEMFLREIQGVAQDINLPGVGTNMRYMTPNWESALYFVVKN